MKTIDIKGKEYVMVNERIMYFWNEYLNGRQGQIVTTLISMEDGICVFKAEAIVDGILMATGHAYEKEGSTFINKTSYVENCETSALGRCLGLLGIGIDTSIASAEEVQNAIKQQEDTKKKTTPKQKTSAYFEERIDKHATVASLDKWWSTYSGKAADELSETEFTKLCNYHKGVREILAKAEATKHVPGELPT